MEDDRIRRLVRGGKLIEKLIPLFVRRGLRVADQARASHL